MSLRPDHDAQALRALMERFNSAAQPVSPAEQADQIRQQLAESAEQGVAEGTAIYYHVINGDKKSVKVFTDSESAVKFLNAYRKKDKTANNWKIITKKNAMMYKEGVTEGHRVVPGFDQEKYQERPGLEGPFHTKSGKVVYYDKVEGKYYDPDTDMYIDYDDWQAMNEQGVTEGSANANETPRSQIIKLYKKGLEDYDIAYDLDIDEKTVADIIDDYDKKQQQQYFKKKGVAEAAGLYGPFTVTINTGERPQSRTKTKRFKREDDAVLWAEDWLENYPQYSLATAEVTDPEGNVVWTTNESDIAEAKPAARKTRLPEFTAYPNYAAWRQELMSRGDDQIDHLDNDYVDNYRVLFAVDRNRRVVGMYYHTADSGSFVPAGQGFSDMIYYADTDPHWPYDGDNGREDLPEGRAGADDVDTVGFSVNSEAAYTAVMQRFGDYIDHDETSGVMYAPARVWPQIEMTAFDADPDSGAVRVEDDVMEQGVAEVSENNPVVNAITRRIMLQRTDLLSKYGPEKVGTAIDEVADFVGDVEEIGSSDVSSWVRHVEQMLGNMEQGVSEANKHSVIGKIQRGHELKKKVDQSYQDIGAAQQAGDKAAGSRAFRKHERLANLERPGTWTKPKDLSENSAPTEKVSSIIKRVLGKQLQWEPGISKLYKNTRRSRTQRVDDYAMKNISTGVKSPDRLSANSGDAQPAALKKQLIQAGYPVYDDVLIFPDLIMFQVRTPISVTAEAQPDRNEMDTPEFQRALDSVKKAAAQGPMKTVYDPRTRKYRVVPVSSLK